MWVCDSPPCLTGDTWDPTGCKCTGIHDGIHNLITTIQNYHVASAAHGIFYQRSEFPASAYTSEAHVTENPAHKLPRPIEDWRHRAILLYTVVSPGGGGTRVVERISDDDGATWLRERTVFVNMNFPEPAGPQPYSGCVVYAAYNSGHITAVRRYPGDTVDSAPFDFKDETGAVITVDNTSFGLRESWDGPGRWILHVNKSGTPTRFQSWDDCETWIEVT